MNVDICCTERCAREGKYVCTYCKIFWYCSLECRRAHEIKHTSSCKQILGGQLIAGSHVSLWDHLCSSSFGGEQELRRLAQLYWDAITLRDVASITELCQLGLSGDSLHAEYIFAKILRESTFLIPSTIKLPCHREKLSAKLLQGAAERHYAYAMEAIASLKQQEGNLTEAVKGWKQALWLCKFPTANYNLGVVYGHGDASIAASGIRRDLRRALKYYADAVNDKSVDRGGERDMTAEFIMCLGWNNESQSSFCMAAAKNYRAVLKIVRQGPGDVPMQCKRDAYTDLTKKGMETIGREAMSRLPPLYPAHVSAKELIGKTPLGNMGHVGAMTLQRLMIHDDLDVRQGHLRHIYRAMRCGRSPKLTVKEHKQSFEQAGLKFATPWPQIEAMLGGEGVIVTANDVIRAGGHYEILSNYVPLSTLQQLCDTCNKKTDRRCVCGGVFCSHKCLHDAWGTHGHECSLIRENNPFLLVVKEIYWTGDFASPSVDMLLAHGDDADFTHASCRRAAPVPTLFYVGIFMCMCLTVYICFFK
jgi:hypothetical protein